MKSVDVIILAGGKGTRLQEVVSDVPKPMASVCGKPFLTYLMDFLSAKGVENVILSTGYKHEVIAAYFGNKYKHIAISYVVENKPLGTGGAIKYALNACTKNKVIIYNGDTLFLADPNQLLNFQKAHGNEIAIFLKEMQHPTRYGTVAMEGHHIIKFKEKDANIEEGLINAGVYCFDRSLLDHINTDVFSFETEILEPLAMKGALSGLVSDAYFIDIGIPEDYEKANKTFDNLVY